MKSNAITALQYGVDARMIALKGAASPQPTPLVFVNPTILSRSPEERQVQWEARQRAAARPQPLAVEGCADLFHVRSGAPVDVTASRCRGEIPAAGTRGPRRGTRER